MNVFKTVFRRRKVVADVQTGADVAELQQQWQRKLFEMLQCLLFKILYESAPSPKHRLR